MYEGQDGFVRLKPDFHHILVEPLEPPPLSPARGPTCSATCKPDSRKGCADGEKLLTQRWCGGSFEATAQTDLP